MSVGDPGSIVAVVAVVVLAGVMSIIETVANRLPLVRALALEDEELRGAASLVRVLEQPTRTTDVTMVLTIAFRAAGAALATVVAIRHLDLGLAVATVVVLMTVLGFVVSEVVARTLASRHLERAGRLVAGPALLLTRVLHPVVRLLASTGRALVGGASASATAGDDATGNGGDEREDEAPLEPAERAMIEAVFELGDTVAREIMTPRPDMVTVARDAPIAVVLDTIVARGHSRLPVYGKNRDDLVGVVYAKDVLARLHARPGDPMWSDLMRPAVFVPETKRVDDLLRSLREEAVHLALVVDEYGAIVGLVTIEDVLEEIVGEIVDEHDREEPMVEVMPDGRFRVDGRLPVEDLAEMLGTDLPDDGFDTVGGLVLDLVGRVPRPGEEIQLEGVTFTTERVQGRRISKLIVTPSGSDGAAQDAGLSTSGREVH